jgi:hypothetical protein
VYFFELDARKKEKGEKNEEECFQTSKYPPAEPGALFGEPLKGANSRVA